MAAAGIDWIQLRLKSGTDRWRHEVVARVVDGLDVLAQEAPDTGGGSTSPSRASLWMDDRADLAALFGDRLGGVHVGQLDLPPRAVRQVVGDGVLIGLSCHDERQVGDAEADPDVDVVACGPIFATRSKADPGPTVGLDGLARLRRLTGKPLVAIGGIDRGRIASVLAAGADRVAILGALYAAGTEPEAIRATAAGLLDEVRRAERTA
jgi:thiamine-phosphate diphosphorylase